MTTPGIGTLIVVDVAFGDASVEHAVAGESGLAVRYCPGIDLDDPAFADPSVVGVLVRRRPIDADAIARMPHIRVIGRYGTGVDGLDVPAAQAAGIAIVSVPDYCAEEVGQHALALLLSAWRRIGASTRYDEHDPWTAVRSIGEIRPLSQCTLGIVGSGRTGGELARQAAPLFSRICMWDPRRPAPPGTHAAASLSGLLRACDVVSLHCPLTDETRGMLDAEMLAQMRAGSLLVNAARGEIVDANALLDGLDSGRPAAAALDVLGTADADLRERFRAHPAVTVTPHLAWYSTRSLQRLRQEVTRRCAAVVISAQATPDTTDAAPVRSGVRVRGRRPEHA